MLLNASGIRPPQLVVEAWVLYGGASKILYTLQDLHSDGNIRKRSNTYCSVTSLESGDSLLCSGELVLGGKRLQNLKGIVPKLIMVLVQQHNETGALRVEG